MPIISVNLPKSTFCWNYSIDGKSHPSYKDGQCDSTPHNWSLDPGKHVLSTSFFPPKGSKALARQGGLYTGSSITQDGKTLLSFSMDARSYEFTVLPPPPPEAPVELVIMGVVE